MSTDAREGADMHSVSITVEVLDPADAILDGEPFNWMATGRSDTAGRRGAAGTDAATRESREYKEVARSIAEHLAADPNSFVHGRPFRVTAEATAEVGRV